MKSLKNHLSVIFPLFVLLFSLQFSLMSDKIVKNFAYKLNNEYNIIVVSSKKIDEAVLMSKVRSIKSIEEISSKKILDRLKGNISSKNISLLKVTLPKFYSIKLKSFPNVKELENIKRKLLETKLITKVETFSKTYSKIYKTLVLLKSISFLFSSFIIIVSVLLMFKQMRIWLLEHKERMSIMSLFGAPFWMKSAVLYRLAIVDSFVSAILVSLVFIFLPNIEYVQKLSTDLEIELPKFDLLHDSGILLGVSLVFSVLIVSLVIRKMKL